jgi:chromosome segregation ATPase
MMSLKPRNAKFDDMKKTLDDVKDMCKKKSAHRGKDNEDIVELKNIVEEQRVEITCLRKHREEIPDRYQKLIDDYKNEFKAKKDDIKCLKDSSKQMKQQISDLKEELSERDVRFIELQDKITSKEKINEAIQSTQTYLFDEIVQADSEHINVELQTEVDALKKEIVESKIHAQTKITMLQNLEFLQSANQEKKLKHEENIRLCVKWKSIPKCKYGVFCKKKDEDRN